MMSLKKHFVHIKSINQLHAMVGYDKPKHPLITILDYTKIDVKPEHYNIKMVTDFYMITLKSPAPIGLQYGRQYYDFEEGTMMFMAPGQAFSASELNEQTKFQGWGLWFHPDLIINTTLSRKIKDFNFFSYSVNEALHLSEVEKNVLEAIVANIETEYKGNMDTYSQKVIVTAIEQLLNYSQRFYGRQFFTRKKINTDVVSNFEQLVNEYFKSDQLALKDLPNVEYFAQKLNLSSAYLTDLLKRETSKTTKEYLQVQIVEQAKYKLLNSNESVSQIAFSLGFDYPQYFNRLFKSKTGITPLRYRTLN